ncbi:MAG TPA: universal stress protein [Gemmatimonadales bacterium]|jgi:nucleotide-binding universal stress UspA family protein
MELHHILAATDESDAGRQAVRTAIDLMTRTPAKVTAMRVVSAEAMAVLSAAGEGDGPPGFGVDFDSLELGRLRRWLEADVVPPGQMDLIETDITFGLPGIEICRYAERNNADLVVLGRKHRSQFSRLLLGDTADAVARRSRVPCLFVPPGRGEPRTAVVALDGTERGLAVLREACGFVRSIGGGLRVVTVERTPLGEPARLSGSLPLARSAWLQGRVNQILADERLPLGSVTVRRGEIVPEILSTVSELDVDLLVIGYHRGGPPGVLEAGSTARHLAHTAPCAVLTIPL